MVTVELRHPDHEGELQTVATATVKDGRADFQGQTKLFNTDTPVIDRRVGGQVRFADDPETWLRNLDTILRSGHLHAVVVEDTNPNPPRRAGKRSPVTIKDQTRSYV